MLNQLGGYYGNDRQLISFMFLVLLRANLFDGQQLSALVRRVDASDDYDVFDGRSTMDAVGGGKTPVYDYIEQQSLQLRRGRISVYDYGKTQLRPNAKSSRSRNNVVPDGVENSVGPPPEDMVKDGADPPNRAGFVGLVEQLAHNGKDFFERIEKDGPMKSIRTTTTVDPSHSAVMFASFDAFLTTKVFLSSAFTISFKFKTVQKDGLLIYHSTSPHEHIFLVVELYAGNLRYIFDFGTGQRLLRTSARFPMDDNQWHDVSIVWHSPTEHQLRVDNGTSSEMLPRTTELRLDGNFYVGGVGLEKFEMLPKKVKSRRGFQGCISGLVLGGTSVNMLDDGVSDIRHEYQEFVKEGCAGPSVECSQSSCENGGECVQGIDTIVCDCDLTSFTGPTCGDDSIAYSFGGKGGLIHFTHDERQRADTPKDTIAFGISTQQDDAVLLRIGSLDYKDFIQIELAGGSLFAVYNLGMVEHRVGQQFHKVNDDMYHRVSFIRNGANSTMNVDNIAIDSYQPPGRQLNVFNSQSNVLIGGIRTNDDDIIHKFFGTLVGLVINGMHILDMAAEGDDRVKMVGDIELDTKPLKLYQSFTPYAFSRQLSYSMTFSNTTSPESLVSLEVISNGLPSSADDLILTGEEAECRYDDDDEEDCFDNKIFSDAFILPVVKLTTNKPFLSNHETRLTQPPFATATRHFRDRGGSGDRPCLEDDEDCDDAAGSVTLLTKLSTTTSLETTRAGRHESVRVSAKTRPGPTSTSPHTTSPRMTSSRMTSSRLTSSRMSSSLIRATSPTSTITSTSTMSSTTASTTASTEATTTLQPSTSSVSTSSKRPVVEVVIRVTTPSGRTPIALGDNATGHVAHESSTTPISSQLETYPEMGPLRMNIGLIVGIAVAVSVLMFTLVYVFANRCRKDNGSIALEEAKGYEQKLFTERKLFDERKQFDEQKLLNERLVAEANRLLRTDYEAAASSPPKRKDVKEWYV